jgi:hypothetical protein
VTVEINQVLVYTLRDATTYKRDMRDIHRWKTKQKKYSQWASIFVLFLFCFVLFCLPLTFSLDKQKSAFTLGGMKWWRRLRCLHVYQWQYEVFLLLLLFDLLEGHARSFAFRYGHGGGGHLCRPTRTMNDGPTSDQCLCLCLSERKQLLSYCFTFIVSRCDLAS